MGTKRKIVIISRAIFPLTAPRPMRATELAKEFARQGHKVTLYGVLGNYDYSEFQQKYKIKIKNLGPTIFSKLNSDGENKISVINRVTQKIFHKILEYPDLELAIKVNKVLKEESNIDLLITIAIPYPIHWGAAFNKSFNPKFPKVWIADCGDPYMGNVFHKKPFYFKYIEKWFGRKVDFITIPIKEAKNAYYKEFHNKIRVIPQGFDFEINENQKHSYNEVLTFIYAGVFYENKRDPRLFLDYLKQHPKDFNFIIYTKNKRLIEKYKEIGGKIVVRDYIPREKLIEEMKKADFLINFENPNVYQSPSKLIDYAIAKRPILSVNGNNPDFSVIDEFLNRNYQNQLKVENVEQYHITNVVSKFLELC